MEKDKLKLIMNEGDLDSLETGDVVGAELSHQLDIDHTLTFLTFRGYDNGNLRVLEGIMYENELNYMIEWIIPKGRIRANIDGSIRFNRNRTEHKAYRQDTNHKEYSELKTLMQESGVI